MTCLIDKVLDGAGMKSHTSLLGTFLVHTLGPHMQILNIKSSLKHLEKTFHCSKITTMKINFFPNISGKIFLEIGIQRAKVYTKNVPDIEVCEFIHGPSRTSPIKQVIAVLYLWGVWLHLCSGV